MHSSFGQMNHHRSASFDIPVVVLAEGPSLAERVREAFGDSVRVHHQSPGDGATPLDTSLRRGVALVEVTPGTPAWDEWFLISGHLCQQQPVALVSQETSARAVTEAFRAGVSDVLVEPLDTAQIRTAVERLLTRRPAIHQGAATQRWAAAALAAVKPAGERLHPAVLLGRAVDQLVLLTSSPAGSALLVREDGELRLVPPVDLRFEGHQLREDEIETLRRSAQGDAVRFVPLGPASGGHRWTLLAVPIHGFAGRRALLALRVGEATRRRIQFERAELAFFADEIGRAWEASQLQRMIHAAKQEYESIVDSTTDYLLLLDSDYRIRRVNRATQQALGLDFAKILGKPLEALFPNVQPAKSGTAGVDAFLRRSAEGPGGALEVRNLLKEGDTHEIRAYPGPSEPDGRVTVLFVKDIGDLRRMEYQLRQSEKLASLGTLAAGVAHEINNPVGYIKSNLGRIRDYVRTLFDLTEPLRQALVERADPPSESALREMAAGFRRDWADKDVEDIREDRDTIFTECFEGLESVEIIVQNLKQYAAKGGLQEPNLQIVHVAKGALRLVWNRLKYTTSVVQKLDKCPPVRGSSVELMQVLVNLLVNAADATAECKELGRAPEVRIESRAHEGGTLLVVADNGPGIPPEIIDRIFDPFFTTKGPSKGTGLGLSISAEILNRHNARIEVDSAPERGTEFRIWFPPGGAERVD